MKQQHDDDELCEHCVQLEKYADVMAHAARDATPEGGMLVDSFVDACITLIAHALSTLPDHDREEFLEEAMENLREATDKLARTGKSNIKAYATN